jgi:ATP-binding protein involved in chromosome partitioning
MHGNVEKDLEDIKEALKNVKKIIAVASGKGGVGKSTISAGLAAALREKGFKTGLLDADVYGPSIPEIFGINTRPAVLGDKMAPVDAAGISVMSIGFLVDEKSAMIWRGPMMSSVIRQLLKDVIWEELDFLVIDLPPGTGDASLTISQSLKLDGVIFVTTPHKMAAKVAARAVDFFKQLGVSVIGFVENMTHSVCPKCGEKTFLYGSGALIEDLNGAKKIASMPVLSGDDFEGFIKQGKHGAAYDAFMGLADQTVIMLKK